MKDRNEINVKHGAIGVIVTCVLWAAFLWSFDMWAEMTWKMNAMILFMLANVGFPGGLLMGDILADKKFVWGKSRSSDSDPS